MPHFHLVAGPEDGPAFGVAEDEDDFGADDFCGKFHRSDDVFVEHVARDADAENVAQTLVEDEFCRGPRVDAAQNGGKRVLRFARFVDLMQQIAVDFEVVDEPIVAVAQQLERIGWADFVLQFFCEGAHFFG